MAATAMLPASITHAPCHHSLQGAYLGITICHRSIKRREAPVGCTNLSVFFFLCVQSRGEGWVGGSQGPNIGLVRESHR